MLRTRPGRAARSADRHDLATSIALSKDLRKLGWKFVGPTTVFAFIQARGLINDHTNYCAVRSLAQAERLAFTRPGR
ncbi:DNA-3-methyladenine glycosylase I [Streptomyces sp. 6-11-2]|uniref:DNA-3-methyladenine glycosylase I n=1 Tax=Streptomyces sp. 6-11-2 TaxID=2585753 RepID=UPI001C0F0ECC|nr:DNA-3-methyladenine glycosylase I [Streptomyces sp. 6-11-2]